MGELSVVDVNRHISISEYFKTHFDGLSKVSFVRNPFDRIASLYEHTKHFHPNEPELKNFESFVDWYVDKNARQITRDDIRKTQFEMLSINGKLAMDYIGRFETFNEDLSKIFSEKISAPITNKYKYKDYREYYNDTTKQIIAEYVKDDLKHFNYSFE